MIKSMTGYGRAESLVGGEKIVVEVKSTNHRYCDIFLRIPPKYSTLENEIKGLILSRLKRGRIDLFLQFESEEEEEQNLELNESLAQRYYLLLKQLKENLQLPEEITLSTVLTQKDVIVSRLANQDEVYEWEVLKDPVSTAVDELVKMREEEGFVLENDILSRLKNIEHLVDVIESISNSALKDQQKSLREKIQALSDNIEIDESRLAP